MMNHHRYNKSTRSFTLIEMLVVISIIGVLASTILAALGGARRQGKYAGAVQFSTELYRFMGDQAAAIFTFDNNLEEDSSGNNVGVASYSEGSTIMLAPPAECFKGSCLKLTPGSIDFTLPESYNPFMINYAYALITLPSFTGTYMVTYTPLNLSNKFTISFWLNTSFNNNNYSNTEILSDYNSPGDLVGAYKIGVYKGVLYAFAESHNTRTITLSADSTPSTHTVINDGQWHNIAFEVNRNKLIVYIDGHLEAQSQLPSGQTFDYFNESHSIDCPNSVSCVGYLDELYYYKQAISAEAIHDMYLAQLEERKKFVASTLR
ncbi:MAG: prepilin-type N-terminal cleavage/methylation domain-containing protein [Patescibacteria group bacterium]|nr:prepilin-type N-terminal cleavage/methylation domain-containing protein [Patescibacteria group bacterium]